MKMLADTEKFPLDDRKMFLESMPEMNNNNQNIWPTSCLLWNHTDCINESQYTDESDLMNHTPVRDSLAIVIPITIIYCLIFITGVIGNICTCIVISRNKSMHTATNYYLFSLAISDFVLLVSSVPVEMFIIWYKYPYVFGETFCILRGVAAEASANATVLTILVFTVERYVAICHPFLSHTLSKLSRAVKLIIVVWIVSFAYAIPQALQFGVVKIMNVEQCVVIKVIMKHSFELSTFLFFFAPMTLITVLYILIGVKLRASTKMTRENGSMQKRYHNTTQSTRRVIKMLVCVVVAFFLCWAPFHAQRLIYIYGTNNNHQASHPIMLKLYIAMTYISGVLYYLSTCINPLLYNIMSRKFRAAFKETLQKICGMSPKNDCPKRTYRMLTRGQREYHYGASTSKQNSSEFSGSYKDSSLYTSSVQRQSYETITMSARTMLRDKHTGINYSDKCNSKFSQHVEQNANLDNDTNSGGFREIHVSFVPTFQSLTEKNIESNPPNVSININMPSTEGGDNSQNWCNGPNIILSYNKQENVEITISNNLKLKIKKMKQSRYAKLSKMVKFIAFKKDDDSLSKGKCGEKRNSTIHLNIQKILDDNSLYSNNLNQKYSIRESKSCKLGFNDSHKYLCDNENELDAYMRELKSRNESNSDP